MDVELVLSTVLAFATVCYTIINLMMWFESRATRKQKITPQVIAYLKTTEEAFQQSLNAALKVNMFTQYNAKVFNVTKHTISEFYSELDVSEEACPTTAYASWEYVNSQGTLDAIFTGSDGKSYRLPTFGESALLLPTTTTKINTESEEKYYPWWNNNASTNTNSCIMVNYS